MTAKDMLDALNTRYSPPEWVFITEVPDAAGFAGSRRADAIAMNLWPSRGLEIHGFELKRRRQDWVNELRNPAKASAFFHFVDRWWLCVSDMDIVKAGELPPQWGLMLVRKRCYTKVQAPLIDHGHERAKDAPLDRLFVAAMLKKAQRVQHDAWNQVLREAHQQGRESGKKSMQLTVDRLQDRIKRFEEASGVTIDDWHARDIGEAVRMVLDGDHLDIPRRLRNFRNLCERTIKEVNKALGEGDDS